jgi:GNAT acetyltransferase-like protein
VVRKAEAAGAEVRVTSAPPSLERFQALYDETMSRLGAGSFYFFPAEYWEQLLALGKRLLVLEALADGELAASLLCLAAPPWLHYHLGATSERGRQTGAANLLMLRAADWAKERGFRLFHLGGGVGAGEDSLFTYKERFAPGETREAWIGKGVHDPVRYRELAGDEVRFEGFFPAYRSRD